VHLSVRSLIALLTIGGALAPVRGQSPVFTDVTAAAGVTFVHVNGASGALLIPEVIGPGGALLDYDNDGDLDLFAVQGSVLPPPAPAGAPRSRLFRNDGGPPEGGPYARIRFTDVTDQSGLAVSGYGMGAATGDIDNDGWVDLYVTALGATRLLRNNRNGTFSDITAKSGTGNVGWTTSASFLDYDRDGWLDLYVAAYLNFRPDMKRACFSAASARDYCAPSVYEPLQHRLWRNNGDATFTDVSLRAGIAQQARRGLGVLATDVNNDGWTDLYVANDGDPNQLWINQRNGTFRDAALLSGVAVSRSGRPQGSMGIDAGDVDGDGDEELFVTNLDNEGNALYLNVGGGLFEERTVERGLFALGFTGFGTRFVDYDNDGWLDLVVANGAVRHLASQARRGDPSPLRQRNQLFRNQNGRFADVSAASGAAFTSLQVGRGVAIGDLDNDGDSDLVVFGNNGPLTVHRNDSGHRRHWLGVRVLDGRAPRDALQARVTLTTGRRPLVRRIQVDGSYCASSDPRVIFGLGETAAPQGVRVQWDDGRTEEFSGLTVDRYWILEPGKPPRAAR
jgi:hypothetical protein